MGTKNEIKISTLRLVDKDTGITKFGEAVRKQTLR